MTYYDPDKDPELNQRRPRDTNADDDDFVPDISKRDWDAGDRVLAPWTRSMLWVGTVSKVAETEVYVEFDDGDHCWAPKDQVRSLETLRIGNPVYCRWQGGTLYAGRITQWRGAQVFVQYDDGDSEWTTISMIAVPSGLPPTWGESLLGLLNYAWIFIVIALCLFRGCRLFD